MSDSDTESGTVAVSDADRLPEAVELREWLRWAGGRFAGVPDPGIVDRIIAAVLLLTWQPGEWLDMDAAWAEAVAALPEGVGLELAKLALDDSAEAVAGDVCVQAESPTAALRALAAAYNGVRPAGEFRLKRAVHAHDRTDR